MVHQGEIVEKVVRASGIPITKLAALLKKNPKTLYNWFEQPNMKIESILSIGKVIHHDFSEEFKDIKEIPTGIVNEPEGEYGEGSFKDRYYKLLEDQNKLLKKGEENYNTLAGAILSLARAISNGVDTTSNTIKSGSSEINQSLLTIARMIDDK